MGDDKLLEAARESPHDWSPGGVIKLLKSFGFECWEGRKHTVCRHKSQREVYCVIPRHRRVLAYVVREAVKAIDGLPGNGEEDG